MRRSQQIRTSDVPRLLIRSIVQVAGLFGGRYRRIEGSHILAIDDAGRILVVRTTYLGPGWMLPGGRVEHDEAPHEAAQRETREETGLEARVDRLVLVDGRHGRDVSFVFLGTIVGGELQPQLGEIAEVGWVARDEIAATSPRLHRLLEIIDEAGDGVGYWGLDRA
jgi:ADP-ribose pyrophosphatase YjhB (NUDIX family)